MTSDDLEVTNSYLSELVDAVRRVAASLEELVRFKEAEEKIAARREETEG